MFMVILFGIIQVSNVLHLFTGLFDRDNASKYYTVFSYSVNC